MHSSALTWTCTYTHRASAMKSLVCCAAGTWDWWKRSWESFSTHNGLYSKFQPSHCLFQNTDSASREHTNSCRREWGRRYSPPWCRGYLPPPHGTSESRADSQRLLHLFCAYPLAVAKVNIKNWWKVKPGKDYSDPPYLRALYLWN